MRFISTASYYGSGSSAYTDLISEYETVCNFSDTEFRFIQNLDGISELEYNLVENWNRSNSGHALKRYKKLVDYFAGDKFSSKFEAYFHGNWRAYSYKYIDDLTDFTFVGNSFYTAYDEGLNKHFIRRAINKLLKKTIWRRQPERGLNTHGSEVIYCSDPGEEKFLSVTKKYIMDLFGTVANGKNFIMVDQIVAPNNANRYKRYFDDIKIIVVDRDPRDIWVLEKYVWKDGIIPHQDVETFVKWFKYTRRHRQYEDLNNDTVIFAQFEDLVFHYDETVDKIERFIGLNPKHHKYLYKHFDPSKSVSNTQTWYRLKGIPGTEIQYIEEHLSAYLYSDFPEKKDMTKGTPGYL